MYADANWAGDPNDSVGVTYLYYNIVFYSCMKHIDVDFYYFMNLVQAHQVLVTKNSCL